MKKIRFYLLDHWALFSFAILSLIIAVVLDMMSPLVISKLVDDVIVARQFGELKICLIAFVIIGVGRSIFQYTKEFSFDMAGSQIAVEIRTDVFHYIQGLSADFFDKTSTGELMARVKDDVDHIWDGITFIGMLLIEVVFHTGLILFLMYRLSWKLAIFPTICMIICGFIAIKMENKLGNVYEEISEENAELTRVAEEDIAGVRTVKAFAREKHEINKFLAHNSKFYDLNMKQQAVFVKYNPYFSVITKLLPLVTILIGGYEVIFEEMTLGRLSAFVAYSTNIVWPMEMLGWLINSMSSAVASTGKLEKIYAVKPAIVEKENPVILDEVKGDIEFRHVTFAKADGHEILKDVSFHVGAGKTIGIMGATGAGKSSIVFLLQRLYDCSKGGVYVDGVDVKDMSLSQLRRSISSVMQDVFLFSDTIKENESLGKRDSIDFETIKEASKKAQASDFIERMDEGYDTVIGERGVGLSGGQKQRISIARALAKKNPILVLDDSTSALDSETEKEIEKTLYSLTNTTKMIIAHRISAVRNADEIIVLDEGRVSEAGTHDELMAKRGLYYQTYVSQYGEIGGNYGN